MLSFPLLTTSNFLLVEGFEAAFGPEENKPVEVTPIGEGGTIQSHKSLTVLHRASASSSPGRVGSFGWRVGSLKSA